MQNENENTAPDYLGMSDADIMAMEAPAPMPASVVPDDDEAARQAEAQRVATEQAEADRLAGEEAARVAAEEKATADAAAAAAVPPVVSPLAQEDGKETPPATAAVTPPADKKPEGEEAKPPVVGENGAVVPPAGEAAPVKAATAEDHKALYDMLLAAPIRANGKDIQLQSPEEVVRVLQMGLNYTKKMQAMQPHLRVVKMLENNKLGEADLSYLIDLHQRKPEAIQKLLHDSQFDAHSVDADKAASYVPGNHQVTDKEMQFQTVLDEVEASDTGKELISEVAQQWDPSSRQALFQNPQLLVEINKQKASGLYASISNEVERRQALGELQGVPFLAAYESVGNDMHAKGLLVPKVQEQVPPKREPVEVRTVVPQAAVTNDAQARAASPTKQTPAPAQVEVSYLGMSDEAFLKQMQGRV